MEVSGVAFERSGIYYPVCHERRQGVGEQLALFYFLLFGAAGAAYGSSQARGRIRALAAGLYHSHSNGGSELCLPPTPQLTVTADPQPTEQGHGSNLHPHGY